MNGPLILGMDGGGTCTTSWLADATGIVLGRGVSGPSNIKSVGAKVARNAIDLSVLAAFQDAGLDVVPVAVSCLGLAGFDRPEDRGWLREWAAQTNWVRNLLLVNDGDLVVAAGTPNGHGVGVIAGTGSIAVGVAEDGRRARAGGWGFIFGDEGSGYAIAVAALRRVARLADGRDKSSRNSDPLTRHICESLEIPDTAGLVAAVYRHGFDRAWVASLVPAVIQASREDDRIVREIIEPAGQDLADIVAAVARKLGRESGVLPLAMAGGFILNCDSVLQSMLGALERVGYAVHARRVETPVEGALILAQRALRS